MKRGVVDVALVLLFGIVVLGCEPPKQTASNSGGPPAPPGSGPPPPATSTPPASPGHEQAPLPPETTFGVFAGGLDDLAARPGAPQPVQPASPAPAPDSDTERVKAQAGVGAKGRSLDPYQGAVVTPVKAFFAGRERAFFDIEFPGNYRTWRAQEDRAPQDFDELKARFLDPMGLTKKLPVLPRGAKYVWDGEKEELQVERPRQQ
jgi:hypothetical protein